MQTNPLALFGDHLARLRKARGWSQEKLALESGLARSYVSGIERGRRNVALVNICVLADTLGVPTSEMLRFAQAASAAQDPSVSAEPTPLPQISRSLCRLENRDQVWLAEIIRSLSSRLSHAAPQAATGVSVTSPNDMDTDDGKPGDARDTVDGRQSRHDDVGHGEAHRPTFIPDTVRTTIAPGFDAGFPSRHPFSASVQADGRHASTNEEDVAATTSRTQHVAADTTHHIREPDSNARGDQHASLSPRSDTFAQDDARRLPGSDED